MRVDVVPGPHWYVIRTGARQEERAVDNLNAWGVETFLPKFKRHCLNHFTGRATFVATPMFSRYAFARFDAAKFLHRVSYTRGVHSVLNFGGVPAKVDDSTIGLIKSQIGDDGLVKMIVEFEIGEPVKITNGPFRNFVGVFDYRTNNARRVAILLTAVGSQARVVLESTSIEKINVNFAS
ncbi:MAG: transcription termination/antitermination protein NusG [Halobacteriota archaeon]